MSCLTSQYISKAYGWLHTLDGKVLTQRQYERAERVMSGIKYLPGAITPSRSVRARKRAFYAVRKLRACDHDYEVQTAGGGGCDQFPEPTYYYLQCCMCSREIPATYADLSDGYDDPFMGMGDWYT